MRKISLTWAENPCGNRPTAYEVWVKSSTHPLTSENFFESAPRLLGTTTETNFYHEEYSDRGILYFGICGKNSYGRGIPEIITVDQVVAGFVGQQWNYNFEDEAVSGVFLETGPSNLTASIIS